jgi:glycosyltransferase involved in cell wall biosynthesis
MLPFAPGERKRYPFSYYRFRLLALKYLQSRSFNRADLVIFLSHYAQSIIDQYLPHRRGRSLVIPHGINEHFRYRPDRPFPPHLPPEYVLYVSILDVYKAQLEVIQAWRRLKEQRMTKEKLVLVGPAYPSYGEKVHNLIKSLGLANDVLVLGEVPYEELPAYYHHAKINIFASSCENCPNILLEALAAGRPVLSSAFQPMPEFGQEAAAYFDPYKPDRLTDLLIEYLDNEDLREMMGKKALARAEHFQWPQSAHRTWEALLELAEQ